MVPISQGTFQDSDLVQLANEELQLKLVSDILKERENFFLTSQTTPMLASVDTYNLPSRAIGNALKNVWFVDPAGNRTKLEQRDITDLDIYGSSGTPDGFYLRGDQIVLMPKPSVTGGSIEFDFFARPNRLVFTTSCAKIMTIVNTTGLTTFTVDTDLSSTLPVGSLIDVIRMTSPFVLWGYQVPIVAITATTIQVASGLVSDQAGNVTPIFGDYIAMSGTANIAQVPQEFHSVLAQMVANRLLLGLGDMQKYNVGMETLKEDRMNALALIKNRVEASPMRINSRSGMVAAFARRW